MDIKFIRDDVYEKSITDLNEIISKLSKKAENSNIVAGERFLHAMILARKTMSKKKVKKKTIVEKPEVIKLHIPSVEKLKKIIPEIRFEKEKFKTHYPLIILRGLNGEIIAKTYIEQKDGKLYYHVEEKTPDMGILDGIKKEFFKKFIKDRKVIDNEDYIRKLTKKILKQNKKEFSQETFDMIRYNLRRDFLGFGKIESLIEDEKITNISCKGPKKPITVNYDNEQMETNLKFDSNHEIDLILTNFGEKIGKTISETNPHIDGTFNNFRIQANLGTRNMTSNFVITRIP